MRGEPANWLDRAARMGIVASPELAISILAGPPRRSGAPFFVGQEMRKNEQDTV